MLISSHSMHSAIEWAAGCPICHETILSYISSAMHSTCARHLLRKCKSSSSFLCPFETVAFNYFFYSNLTFSKNWNKIKKALKKIGALIRPHFVNPADSFCLHSERVASSNAHFAFDSSAVIGCSRKYAWHIKSTGPTMQYLFHSQHK